MSTNGKLATNLLTSIGNGHRLSTKAAPYFLALAEAFRARFGKALYVKWSYRTYAEQVEMRKKHGTGAAIAGTSNHGLGLSLDLWSGVDKAYSAEHRWMQQNAPAYGFINDVAGEPWHWTFKRTPTINLNRPPAPIKKPITLGTTKTMYVLKNKENGDIFAVTEEPRITHLGSPAHANLLAGVASTADEIHELTKAQLDTVLICFGIPTSKAVRGVKWGRNDDITGKAA